MTTPPLVLGESVTDGRLYRLIRPTFDVWLESGRPSPQAYRPDPDGLSTVIPTTKATEKMNSEKWKDYAIYSIDVPRLRTEVPQIDPARQRRGKQPHVRVVEAFKLYDPEEWLDDHVVIRGLSRGLLDWIRDLAREVRPPGPLRDSIKDSSE